MYQKVICWNHTRTKNERKKEKKDYQIHKMSVLPLEGCFIRWNNVGLHESLSKCLRHSWKLFPYLKQNICLYMLINFTEYKTNVMGIKIIIIYIIKIYIHIQSIYVNTNNETPQNSCTSTLFFDHLLLNICFIPPCSQYSTIPTTSVTLLSSWNMLSCFEALILQYTSLFY